MITEDIIETKGSKYSLIKINTYNFNPEMVFNLNSSLNETITKQQCVSIWSAPLRISKRREEEDDDEEIL